MRYIRKLILNLCVLATEAGLGCTLYNLVRRNWMPTFGFSVFGALAVVLWLLIRIGRRRGFRWQPPGMAKTTLTVTCIAVAVSIMAAFAGIEPFLEYKNRISDALQSTGAFQGSYATARLSDIGFGQAPQNLGTFLNLNAPALAINTGQMLPFQVAVTPGPTFKGGYVVLLSRDGYFFSSVAIAAAQPQRSTTGDRDYYSIEGAAATATTTVTLWAPSADKDSQDLLNDSNALMAKLNQGESQWFWSGGMLHWLQTGQGMPDAGNPSYVRSQFTNLFNKYFQLRVVDAAADARLQNRQVATWSANGDFRSPLFSIPYNQLDLNWTFRETPAKVGIQLYRSDGTLVDGLDTGAGLDHAMLPASLGTGYYVPTYEYYLTVSGIAGPWTMTAESENTQGNNSNVASSIWEGYHFLPQ